MALLPPSSNSRYVSFEELRLAVNAHAASQGYAIVTKRSKKNKRGVLRKVWMFCDKSRVFKSEGHGRRETSSRSTECPFELIASSVDDSNWSFEVTHAEHNHSATLSGAHPVHRKIAMTTEVQKTIQTQTLVNAAPKSILSAIRLNADDENPLITSRDVYNQRHEIRAKALGSNTAVQAMMIELSRRDSWHTSYTLSPTSRVENLFFTKKFSQDLTRLYPEVFLIDTTYKTNQYRQPLCIITGVTALNTTFYVGFGFLLDESAETYQWMLEQLEVLCIDIDIPNPTVIVTDNDHALTAALAQVMPQTRHLFCLWHMNKNVVSNCRKKFDEEESWQDFYSKWQTVVYANVLSEFHDAWELLSIKYEGSHPSCISYLDSLLKHKDKFIKCYTNKVKHFGNTATSRSESGHAKLKRELVVSTGNLKQVVDKISLLLRNERSDYLLRYESDKDRVPNNLANNFLKPLKRYVSSYALHQASHQLGKLQALKDGEELMPCTHTFWKSMGIPCVHEIKKYLDEDHLLPLSCFDWHWRYYKPLVSRSPDPDAAVLLSSQNPDQQSSPEPARQASLVLSDPPTPMRSQNRDLTARLPSPQFELFPPTSLSDTPITLEIREPLPQKAKGRPVGAKNKRTRSQAAFDESTRRERSNFEIVEADVRQLDREQDQEANLVLEVREPLPKKARGRPVGTKNKRTRAEADSDESALQR